MKFIQKLIGQYHQAELFFQPVKLYIFLKAANLQAVVIFTLVYKQGKYIEKLYVFVAVFANK